MIDDQSAVRVAELFRALGDPLRVRILALLLAGEMNVGAIAQSIGASPSSVSHHLRGLRLLHLVKVRREGKKMFYSLYGEHMEEIIRCVMEWIQNG
jgi:DNA-binding transcriptional ArsR family regulator